MSPVHREINLDKVIVKYHHGQVSNMDGITMECIADVMDLGGIRAAAQTSHACGGWVILSVAVVTLPGFHGMVPDSTRSNFPVSG